MILLRGLFYLISLSVFYCNVTVKLVIESVLSDVHPIKFGLKQEDVSALFCLKSALIYVSIEVQANQMVLTLNVTLRLLYGKVK